MSSKAVSEYMDYATVHGVGRLKNSPFIVLKVIWVLCLCGSLGMVIFQFILLWQKFKSNPVSTNIELKTPGKLDFPVVTICNTNPVNYCSIGNYMQTVIDDAALKYNINTDTCIFENDTSENYSTGPLDNDILWITAEKFRMSLNSLDTDSLRNISQPLSDFVLICNYNGDACTSTSIEEVRTHEYGLCYNIYPEYQNYSTSRKVYAYGKRYGLELLLNIDDEESVPFVTQSGSVYVMVHSKSPGQDNIYLSNGAIVPTGFETDISVNQIEKIRVSGDVENPRCKDTDIPLLECLHQCQQKDIAKNCGCYQYFGHNASVKSNNSYYYYYDDHGGFPPCLTSQDYKCIQSILASYLDAVQDVCSDCKIPCRERYFETGISVASWPSENFVPILRRIVSAAKSNNFMVMDRDYIRSNLVMVRIYLSSLSYESIKEEYSYSMVNFVSDLGGSLGLWAGFSVLSLMEVFELMFLIFASWKQKRNTVREIEAPSDMKDDNNY